jgi:hypothetical protein
VSIDRPARWCASGCPTVHTRIVSAAGVEIGTAVSAPHDHFTAISHCRVKLSAGRCVRCARSCPTICGRIIFSARIQSAGAAKSAPNDHFITRPYCGVIVPGGRRVDSGRSCPTICVRVIYPASVQVVKGPVEKYPPQMIMLLPVHTALWPVAYAVDRLGSLSVRTDRMAIFLFQPFNSFNF